MLKILIVEDDERRVEVFRSWLLPGFRLLWARSAGVAIGMLERDRGHVYAGIMLDHDLGDRTLTSMDKLLSGRHVVQAVIRHTDPDVPIFIHSMNPYRAPENAHILERAGFTVTRMPMEQITRTFFLSWLQEIREIWGEDDVSDASDEQP